jgi:NADPH:quinone reductase-like Zn-dependent oxidoreductase
MSAMSFNAFFWIWRDSACLPNETHYIFGLPREIPKSHLSLIAQLAQEGHLKPVIDRCYSLEETADAYRYVESGHKTGNVVIQVRS